MVEPLQVRGRPVLRASAEDFLRPASLRLERGRTAPDAFYLDRLDRGWTAQRCGGSCSWCCGWITPTAPRWSRGETPLGVLVHSL